MLLNFERLSHLNFFLDLHLFLFKISSCFNLCWWFIILLPDDFWFHVSLNFTLATCPMCLVSLNNLLVLKWNLDSIILHRWNHFSTSVALMFLRGLVPTYQFLITAKLIVLLLKSHFMIINLSRMTDDGLLFIELLSWIIFVLYKRVNILILL
jgi:hypothetical protein